MDVEAGDCQESLQRYYYSPRSGYCYLFKYTGCKGNENNFEYREQCQAKCQGVTGNRTVFVLMYNFCISKLDLACPVYDISNSPGCQMTLIGDDEKLCPIFNVTCRKL